MPDMLVPLYALPDPRPTLDALRAAEVIIRPAESFEKHLVTGWIRQHFGDGWASECEPGFARQPISTLIAQSHGVMLGFACYDCTRRGLFGPTGVAESQRGRGIGKGLLLAALQAMYQNGYAYAVIGGAGPGEFYAKCCGAIPIPNSVPGIYTYLLKSPQPTT